MPGILWPAIPDSLNATVLALQYQLEQSEWWPAAALKQKQMEQLGPLLTHAYRTVPFYREHYRALGFRPKQLLNEELWQLTPILTRQQVQQAGEQLVSEQLPPAHGTTHDISTSGSTGQTVKVKGTQVSQIFWQALTLRDHLWHQRDLSGKLAVIRKAGKGMGLPPQGSRSKIWGSSTGLFAGTGPSVLLSLHASLEQQVEWLQRENPDYLLTYPSLIVELARQFNGSGLKLPKLRGISSLGEVVTPAARKACRDTWGVALTDTYSCQEAGYLALQCPEHDHYHIQSENVVVEILDDNNMPCKQGQTGRVVITPLHNFASPLIRYEIGDYAEVGHACDCGRGLPVLNRIMGRVRNLITLPNGEKKWPLMGSDHFNKVLPVQRFQFIQHTPQDIEVKLVVGRMPSEAEEKKLTNIILDSLGYAFTLRFNYVDTIPRSLGGKYEDFISVIS